MCREWPSPQPSAPLQLSSAFEAAQDSRETSAYESAESQTRSRSSSVETEQRPSAEAHLVAEDSR